MVNSENLCMSCMHEIDENAQECPFCGYDVNTRQIEPYLPVRSILANRYLVGKLLDYNGDGATYIAWDMAERKPVTVREFMPDTLCGRNRGVKEVTVLSGFEAEYVDCLSDFTELWRKLARMSELSALETVLSVFEENNTCYAVSEYIENISLRQYLLRLKTGYMTWDKAQQLFMPVLSTLNMLHTAGIIHRGISPFTLHIGKDGKMRIGGFSIYQARTAGSVLTVNLYPGYSAFEQYGVDYQTGPWTDIYAFGATLYRALIGTDPIEATERMVNDRLMVPGKFAEQLPAYVINALINALQILPEERTRTVEQFRAELSAAPTVSAAGFGENSARYDPTPEPLPRINSSSGDYDDEPKRRSSRSVVVITALISAAILLIAFGAVWMLKPDLLPFKNDDKETVVATTRNDLVTVPTFVKRDYSEIINTPYWTKDFTFQKEEEYSDTVEKGLVVAQNIQPGKEVNAGTIIVLTVSKGAEEFELPEIIGFDYSEAKVLLEERYFTVSQQLLPNDGSHKAGVVQSVANLTIGKQYPKGTAVKLVVWDEVTTEPPTTAEVETTEPTSQDQTEPSDNPTDEPTTVDPDNPDEEQTTGPLTEVTTESPDARDLINGFLNDLLGTGTTAPATTKPAE